jgi:tetratricopeptide (TPR) repeat protein
MFNPGAQLQLQQQFMQGCAVAQQGMMVEASGNVGAAAQYYDQSASILSSCIATAQQCQVPIDAQGWFSLSWCHFNAARVKSMLGWGAAAPAHLMQAHSALNAAIAMNPMFAPYHSAMGVLLATEGQAATAVQAFSRALQLNPGDGFSQYMLAVLNQAQGNVTAGNQYYAAAQQFAPGLPPPQQAVQQHSDGQKGFDWNGLVSTAGELFKAVSSVSNLFASPQGASENSPGAGGGGFGGGYGGGFG